MKRKPRPASARSERRASERAGLRLGADRERLFQLEAGGSPERPLGVSSASVVDVHAVGVPCPRCGGPHELLEHLAVNRAGARLREARLKCRQCGSERSLFFKLQEELSN